MSKTTTNHTSDSGDGRQVSRGAKNVTKKKKSRSRRFDANSKVNKSSVKKRHGVSGGGGGGLGSITKKAIEAEKGQRKFSQRRQPPPRKETTKTTTTETIDSGQGSSSGSGGVSPDSDNNSLPTPLDLNKKSVKSHDTSNRHASLIEDTRPLRPRTTSFSTSESSEFDDLNDLTCPFCEDDLLPGQWHPEHSDEDQAEGPLLYCSKGSLCSRRSKATLKSRKVPGKRKKDKKQVLQLPPKQRHSIAAVTFNEGRSFSTSAQPRESFLHGVCKAGYC